MLNFFTYRGEFYLEFEFESNKFYQFRVLENHGVNSTRPCYESDIFNKENIRVEIYPEYVVMPSKIHLDRSSLLAIYINDSRHRKYACQLSTILLILKALGFVTSEKIAKLIQEIKANNTYCNFSQEYRRGKNKIKVLNLDVFPVEKRYYNFVYHGPNDIIIEVRYSCSVNNYNLVISLPFNKMIVKEDLIAESSEKTYCYRINQNNSSFVLDAFLIISSFSKEDKNNVIEILEQISKHYENR